MVDKLNRKNVNSNVFGLGDIQFKSQKQTLQIRQFNIEMLHSTLPLLLLYAWKK